MWSCVQTLICLCLLSKPVQNREELHHTTAFLSEYSTSSLEGQHHDVTQSQETCTAADSWRVSVHEPPNMKLLLSFPKPISPTETRHVNVFVEIGISSYDFGLYLLDDPTGNRVKNIQHEKKGNLEEQNKEIAYQWLLGNGEKPVTWYTLMKILKKIKQGTLSDMIRDSVSECAMNTSNEGVHYSQQTIELIQTLRNVYKNEDLLDPDLWLSQYLPEMKYINLTLEENGQETNLFELLNDDGESMFGMRMLLVGRPGVGKTTLLRHISKLWAGNDNSTFLRSCQILLKIPLGAVDVRVLNDIEDLLKVALRGDDNLITGLATDLRLNKGRGACLLLDAYDELKTDSARKFVQELLAKGQRELHLPEALYIITSRSVLADKLKNVVNKSVEVVGINETNLELFIKSLPKENQTLIDGFFKRQPNARHLCHVPLYLSMVLYTVLGKDLIHDSSHSIDTETDLFTSFVGLTMEQYSRNRHPDWNRFSLWKCSFTEESAEKQCEGFRALCAAAFQMVFRFRVSVRVDVAQGVLDILQRDYKLDAEIIDSIREDITLVLDITKGKDESRDVIRFSFTDGSYDEFVQALHLAGLPEQETTELHNLVGKGKTTEEHVCTGYVAICLAVNRLMEQRTDGPPVNIMDVLQGQSPDGKSFGFEPTMTETLTNLSLVKISRKPTVYGEVLQFTFPHKTFQEFLCALYMSSLPEHEQLAYIALYGNEDIFNLAFQFFFGLAREKNSNSNVSKLLQRYSSYKSTDHRNVVLKVARETKIVGRQFKNTLQESGVYVNNLSLCAQIKERDDCLAVRYALKQAPVQKLSLHVTLHKSTCMYYSVHRATEVHLMVNCPQPISTYDYLRRQIAPVESIVTYLSVKRCLLKLDDVSAFSHQLKRLKNLQTLHLLIPTDMTIDGAVELVTALGALPHLNSLQLDMEIMCRGTQVLMSLLRQLPFLQHLSLTLRSTDEKMLGTLSYRRQHFCWKYGEDLECPYLPFIDCFCSIHDENGHTQYRGSTSKLATIFLTGNCSEDVKYSMENVFTDLGRLERLNSLVLSISLDKHREAAALFEGQDKLTNITHLDISYNYIFGDEYKHATLNMSKLQMLDIGHTSWKLHGISEALSSAHNLQTIKFTDSRSRVDAAVASFEHLQRLKQLQAIILDFSDVNDSHVEIFSKYVTNMHSLRVLDLGSNSITSRGLHMLLEALHRLEDFHHLDLSYNQISVFDLDANLDHIRYLSLAGNGMGADGAQSLASAMKHIPSVVHLDLSDNKLTSAGALALVHELHLLSNLQHLDLSYNNLNFDYSEVVKLAEALKGIATLKSLSLASNSLPQDSAVVLTKQLTQLHHLDLSNIANQLSLQ